MTEHPTLQASPAPYTQALLRHFADLRDGTHGDAVSRTDKEELFKAAAELLAPHAMAALEEVNAELLLGQGTIISTGVTRAPDTGLIWTWTLEWAEQRNSGVPPITIHAYYGRGFHHPHLRGGTVREWPLNVFTPEHAAAELPTLRAIAAAEIHNLVFLADYTIVPSSKPGTRTSTL
jgi:deoxycytidylate deaminase